MALAAIGHSQYIDNINERSKEADNCKLFYDSAKQEVLRLARPQFARKWEHLALVRKNPNSEWLYEYRYPDDALKVLYIVSHEPALNPRVLFHWGSNGQQKVIYTNEPEATAVIVADTDEQFFDAVFASLLSLKLATYLAMPMAVDPAIQSNVEQRYMIKMNEAMAAIANEEQTPPQRESDMTTAHYGYGTGEVWR